MREQPYVIIEHVDEDEEHPRIRLDNTFVPLVDAVDRLGPVGRILVEFLAYRTEVERLRVQEDQLSRMATIAQNKHTHDIEKIRADLEKVQIQQSFMRSSMHDLYTHSRTTIEERNLSREAFIQALQLTMKAMTDLYRISPLPPAEVIQVYRDTVGMITKQMNDLESIAANQMLGLSSDIRQIFLSITAESSTSESPPPKVQKQLKDL